MARFLRGIVNTILIAAIVVAASLLIPPVAGVTTRIVDDIEMETNLDTGSVAYAWGVDAGTLKVGDEVLLHVQMEKEDPVAVNVYCISSIDAGTFSLEDKRSVDGETIQMPLTGKIDKLVVIVPYLGYISMALGTVEGLIIVGLSVLFVIVLFILAEIWRKDEEDEWDDEEDEEDDGEENAEEDAAGASDKKSLDLEAPSVDASVDAKVSDVEVPPLNLELPVQDDDTKMAKELWENEVNKEEQNLFEETESFFAADIARIMGMGDEESEKDALKHADAEFIDIVPDGVMSVQMMPDEKTAHANETFSEAEAAEEAQKKVLAMPVYSKEELMERANAAGDQPELIEDEVSGITFLDYSDLL